MRKVVTIGTRGSPLAVAQTLYVKGMIEGLRRDVTFEVVRIKTEGDFMKDLPSGMIPGYGFFVREIQKALLEARVDAAVHSMKDLPLRGDPSLVVTAVPEREDPADAFVGRAARTLSELPEGAVLGTGSARRAVLAKRVRPDLCIKDLRGNLNTRIEKLERGDYDGIILALAGVNRLGLAGEVEAERLDPFDFPPAPSQAALAVEVRADDHEMISLFSAIDSPSARREVFAERRFLELVGAGCRLPVGAHARGGEMVAFVSDPEVRDFLMERGRGENLMALAETLFESILKKGGEGEIRKLRGGVE